MSASPSFGQIMWRDLTVADADGIRDFYKAVVGWEPSGVDMGDYQDYSMLPAGEEDAVAGICHARGSNANIPPVWLIYITVEDVSASVAQVQALGGKVLDGLRKMGEATFAVIQDPAGAICALYEVGEA